eukprot:1194930-Prorocentrum_minimum.AAC.7
MQDQNSSSPVPRLPYLTVLFRPTYAQYYYLTVLFRPTYAQSAALSSRISLSGRRRSRVDLASDQWREGRGHIPAADLTSDQWREGRGHIPAADLTSDQWREGRGHIPPVPKPSGGRRSLRSCVPYEKGFTRLPREGGGTVRACYLHQQLLLRAVGGPFEGSVAGKDGKVLEATQHVQQRLPLTDLPGANALRLQYPVRADRPVCDERSVEHHPSATGREFLPYA